MHACRFSPYCGVFPYSLTHQFPGKDPSLLSGHLCLWLHPQLQGSHASQWWHTQGTPKRVKLGTLVGVGEGAWGLLSGQVAGLELPVIIFAAIWEGLCEDKFLPEESREEERREGQLADHITTPGASWT